MPRLTARSRESGFALADGVPRWAIVVATLIALAPLPSTLWRLPLAFGVPMGFSEEFLRNLQVPGFGSVYVVVLGLLSELFAFLAFGLVQRWGERWPGWMPGIAGRRVPIWLAVTIAWIGALAVTVYSILYVYTSLTAAESGPAGLLMWLMHLAYLPTLYWGPALAVLTGHYLLRRRRSDRAGARADHDHELRFAR